MSKVNLVIIGLALAGVVLFVALTLVFARLPTLDNPFQVHITTPPQPTIAPLPTPTVAPPPPGVAYRGVAAIQAVDDTTTGDATGTANASPFDMHQGYPWITDTLFHVADRVPGTSNDLTLDTCIDAGMPSERYFFAQPSAYGAPNSVVFNHGGPNQRAVWRTVATIYGHGRPTPQPTPLPPVPTPSGYVAPTPIPTPGPDYAVYASVWRQNCAVLGGQTITIEP